MREQGQFLPGVALPGAEDGFEFGDGPEPVAGAGKSAGAGHRARLRARLLTGGAEALADYEVLEYLLFAAIKQGDTKPVAKALIAQFGSLAGVLNADPRALQRVKGVGETSAAALLSVATAARRMTRGEIIRKPVLGSWQALIDYLTTDMAHLTVERVRILYLDTRNRLIEDHHLGDGSIDEAAIHPREVIRRAMDVGASAMILVHNHPSGNPEPSRADIQITKRIAEAGRLLGVTVHDHVIIGREGHTSLRAKGLI
ncbi:RadC family protein [Erythrobacter sanguineus]|jgi:DNA repair protein RadC|uniref:DNA repair protein RadC n=1 Tax=Erythrobacter sanguineus TaxID=198312 RepID=A0A1M7SHS1_9SPHN|nr:DNA repair protein RadC [Erythrobacter sanguineus]MCR9181077.1 DNA repair protein RadC [Erythrobacteraceae bacterium]SHN58009.1 DNA repair protein RadC [Erythrobacter sanguineus]